MSVDCRSALYMPASNARALAKGAMLAADALIVDLEDSVAPVSKSTAREQAVHALQSHDYGYRLRALRVNAGDTQWHADDMDAAVRCNVDAIVLPKVERVDDIAQLSKAMDQHRELETSAIWAMLESPLAVVNAAQIASSSREYPRLRVFVIGSNDMALAAGMPAQSDRTCLMPWLMTLVAAAKANGLQILDGVYNNFADCEGFVAECEQGVSMGMSGKSLIHPSQLAIANKVFSPSESEIARAKVIVQTFSLPDNLGKGAISIDGRMIERLHLGMAEQLLLRAKRLKSRG